MTNFHNTLYVTSEGAYVAREGESVVVRVEGTTRMQVPLHHLASIETAAQANAAEVSDTSPTSSEVGVD
jgi:CRISPR-associated protein Cas1